jgi:hypothetical protein
MRFNSAGNSWDMIGAGFQPSGNISIDMSEAGVLYAAYDRVFGTEVRVRRLNSAGNAWDEVEGDYFTAGSPTYLNLKVSPAGIPYVAYIDASTSNQVAVRRPSSGAGWSAVGGTYASAGESNYLTLAFHPNGTPYIAYQDIDAQRGATVRRLLANGSGWETVGPRGFSQTSIGAVTYLALRFTSGGTPFLGYIDTYKAPVILVVSINAAGTAWESVRSVTEPGTINPSHFHMNLSPAGIPYAVIANSMNSDLLNVYRMTAEP